VSDNVSGVTGTARGQIGVRVTTEVREQIDGLRCLFPRADGTDTTRSDVLRALLEGGGVVLDLETIRKLNSLEGFSNRRDALRAVIEAGLAELGRRRSKSVGAP